MKRVTLVIDDEALYRSLKAEAVRQGRTLRQVLQEAMSQWLVAQEEAEDLAAYREALFEEGEDVEASQFFAQLERERRGLPG